jgi:hypothetical protein
MMIEGSGSRAGSGSGSIPLTREWIRIREAQKHVDPDSDPIRNTARSTANFNLTASVADQDP